jgi:hypothetical protein
MASLKIIQIAVELEDESIAVVSLPQERMNMLIGFIEALSEGPIKLVKLPGMKRVPLAEAVTE